MAAGDMEMVEIFEPRASIKDRFPKYEDGLELVEAIFEVYALNRSATLSFWDTSKRNKMIIPHPINERKQNQVLQKYVSLPVPK